MDKLPLFIILITINYVDVYKSYIKSSTDLYK